MDSIDENEQSGKVNNIKLGISLFQTSVKTMGAKMTDFNTVRTPCLHKFKMITKVVQTVLLIQNK